MGCDGGLTAAYGRGSYICDAKHMEHKTDGPQLTGGQQVPLVFCRDGLVGDLKSPRGTVGQARLHVALPAALVSGESHRLGQLIAQHVIKLHVQALQLRFAFMQQAALRRQLFQLLGSATPQHCR